MTPRLLVLLAGAGSAALLLSAWGFQYLGGLAPCAMCIWQRWPHAIAAFMTLVHGVYPSRLPILVGGAAALTTAGIGVYHSGVEQGWWQGPSTCTAQTDFNASAKDALEAILAAPVVRCDEIPWEFLGLSMAGWNALTSFGLAGLWLAALARPQASSSASQ